MKKLEKLNENEFHLVCDFLNGLVLNLKCINWKSNLIDDIIYSEESDILKSKWCVNIDNLEDKLNLLSDIELLELLVEVDLFWEIDESSYQLFGFISPQSKILEIINKQEKHEPIIWNSELSPLQEFFMIAKGIELEFIIYVQDSEGNDKTVWATSESDLLECLFVISEKYHFGRLQRIDTAIEKGFFDSVEVN